MEKRRAIGFEVRTLSNLIRREVEKSQIKKYVDSITGTNGWIIGYLVEHNDRDMFQRDLEEDFSMRRSTATKMLQLMEKKGLIVRLPVDYDARLKKIVLTDRALEIHSMVVQDVNALEQKLSRGLTEQELDAFFCVLEKIKKNME